MSKALSPAGCPTDRRGTRHVIAWLALGAVAVASCDSTSPPRVASVVVTPATATLTSFGETVALSAVARDEKGKDISGKTFVWTSSNDRVVTLGSTPTATAVANGEATISASSDGVTGSAVIQVAQRVAKVEVTPTASVLESIGETRQMAVTAKDARDNLIVTDQTPTWRSLDAQVATVDGSGLVTAVKNGFVVLTATIGGISGSTSLQVVQKATGLRFATQPMTTQTGVTMADVQVAVHDARGHTVATATNAVTVSLAPHTAGGTLTGARTINAVGGVANFYDLAIERTAPGYRMVATSGSLASATSSAFDIIIAKARFESLQMAATTLVIEGPRVSYTAYVTNASGSTMGTVGVQAWIDQGTASRAAGGALVLNCGGSPGVLRRGTCKFEFTIGASNGAAGAGTLTAGSAVARFDLFERSLIIESFRVPITLEAKP
jgi:hypothetical protein